MTVTIVHDSAPEFAPAGRGGVGIESATCVRYTWSPNSGRSRRVTLAEIDHVIGADDVLEYDVFPAFVAEGVPETVDAAGFDEWFTATGVIIDLVLADGTRSSASALVDHHGVRHTAEGMRDSKALTVDQWNRVRVNIGRLAGRRVVRTEVSVVASGRSFEGWIDGPRFVRDVAAVSPAVDIVTTLRGTHSSGSRSRGNTVPAAALPNAFQLLIPVTDATDASWPYSYHRDVDDDAAPGLEAFAVSHTATPWLGDRGVLHLFPLAEDTLAPEQPSRRRRRFARSDETAGPHEYRVAFEDGTSVRLAPGERGAIVEVRSTFANPTLLLTFPDVASDMELVDGIVRGWTEQAGALPARAGRCHYSIVVEPPIAVSEWRRAPDGAKVLLLQFDLRAGEALVVRVGASFISPRQADENLRQSVGGIDADAVVDAARTAWSAVLDRFRLTGASADQRVSFVSSLYRLFLYPGIAHEITPAGDVVHARVGRASRDGHPARGRLSVGNGFWDTYRTAWPAYVLFDPARAKDLLTGFVQHFHDDGWIPRWSNPGAVDLMVGTSADTVFADAAIKGVDVPGAFDAALKDATVPSDEASVGRKGQHESVYRRFVDTNVHEGLSWSIENALCDAAIGRWAALRAEREQPGSAAADDLAALAEYLTHRALDYRVLFDGSVGFFRGLDESGDRSAATFDPRDWGGDYTETNAWGMAFPAPHDVPGLVALHGGRARFEAALDEYFTRPETASDDHVGAYGLAIHEMHEARDIRMGMWALSNQPAHHVPFLYAYTGSPHKTQRITRQALRRCFLGSEIGQGYPGDEDNGEMSAWYVFAALGFYPLFPGSPSYVLTSPLFERADVDLGDDRRLVIIAHDQSIDNVYIQRLTVDGTEWDAPLIPHATIARGATLEFTLGPQPSEWGRTPDAVTHAGLVPREDAPRGRASFAGGEALLDDSSRSEVVVPNGAYVEWGHEDASIVRQYTVSAGAEPADTVQSWRVEARGRDGQWRTIDERTAATFRWPRQLRPFTPRLSPPAHAHRIVFTAMGTASQVELLSDATSPDTLEEQ